MGQYLLREKKKTDYINPNTLISKNKYLMNSLKSENTTPVHRENKQPGDSS